MTKRCKVGMLAYIMHSVYAENIGRVVRVIGTARHPDDDWTVISESSVLSAYCNGFKVRVPIGIGIAAMDGDLFPILPPDADRDERCDLERELCV